MGFIDPSQLDPDPVSEPAGGVSITVHNPNGMGLGGRFIDPSELDPEETTKAQYGAGLANQALQGATLGLSDEVQAGSLGLYDYLKDALSGQNKNIGLGDYYGARLDTIRDTNKDFQAENPIASGAANIAGGIGSAIAYPASLVSKAKSLPSIAAALAGEGAAYGGAYGFGEGEGGVENRIANALQGAKTGAIAAPILGLPLMGVGKAISSIGKIADTAAVSPEQEAANILAKAGKADIQAVPSTSSNPFLEYQTLAEATQNPAIAQLEQQIGKTSPMANARLVSNENARRSLQQELLASLSPETPVAQDEAGRILRSLTEDPAKEMVTKAQRYFESVNPDAEVPIDMLRGNINSLAKKTYEAGGMPGSIKGILEEINKPVSIAGTPVQPSTKPYSYMHALRRRAQQAWADAKAVGDKDAAAVANQIWRGVDSEIERAGELGLMAPEDIHAFTEGKKAFSQYADTFESGPIGYARQKIKEGQYNIPDSSVVNTMWNGKAENTRALLKAIPDTEEAMNKVRGTIRDKILRETVNNDGQFSPSKFRNFIRTKKEGLVAQTEDGRSLFSKDHIDTLEKIADDLAFLDPGSNQSVKALAYKASKGQPTTAQAVMMKDVGKKIVGLTPGGNLLIQGIEAIQKNRKESVNEILTDALFDKNKAKELVSKATPESVSNLIQRLGGAVSEQSKKLSPRIVPASSLSSQDSRESLKDRSQSLRSEESRSSQGIGADRGGLSKSATGTKSQLSGEGKSVSSPRSTTSFIDKAITKAEAKLQGDQMAPKMTLGDIDTTVQALKPAVRKVESAGKANAVSNKGATGLYQIMPATAKDIAKELGVKEYDLKDPKTNERFYEHYMAKMLRQFDNDPQLALAAYNMGPGALKTAMREAQSTDWEDISKYLKRRNRFSETVAYVPKVLSHVEMV